MVEPIVFSDILLNASFEFATFTCPTKFWISILVYKSLFILAFKVKSILSGISGAIILAVSVVAGCAAASSDDINSFASIVDELKLRIPFNVPFPKAYAKKFESSPFICMSLLPMVASNLVKDTVLGLKRREASLI